MAVRYTAAITNLQGALMGVRLLSGLILLLALAGCGQKGSLYREPSPSEPATAAEAATGPAVQEPSTQDDE